MGCSPHIHLRAEHTEVLQILLRCVRFGSLEATWVLFEPDVVDDMAEGFLVDRLIC